ncbi:hypothetical protein VTN00DRAFT_1004 [Thermoascus crustaceus]|uniref:uncharacterized protein n=1 Tax=Thermoascus crustaceus TaxID=5088 RepID=UPI0037447037
MKTQRRVMNGKRVATNVGHQANVDVWMSLGKALENPLQTAGLGEHFKGTRLQARCKTNTPRKPDRAPIQTAIQPCH